jgi:protein O-GlcNAc transferase
VNPLPALQNGCVTFGCLNNFCKINDPLLSLWAQIFRQVENSRLLLLTPEGDSRHRTVERLRREGLDASRVEFVPRLQRRSYLETYRRIDIGLDSFPYNGHTTSLDSFWMGVPIVTLVGNLAVSRAGWSQLSNLGLTELAGKTSEQFAQIAVTLASDLPRLSELRSTLRTRMQQSPLMDGLRFTRNMEAAFREMWRAWCSATASEA